MNPELLSLPLFFGLILILCTLLVVTGAEEGYRGRQAADAIADS